MQNEAIALIETEENGLTVNGVVKGVGKWSPGYNCLKGTVNVFEEILMMYLPCESGHRHVYRSI